MLEHVDEITAAVVEQCKENPSLAASMMEKLEGTLEQRVGIFAPDGPPIQIERRGVDAVAVVQVLAESGALEELGLDAGPVRSLPPLRPTLALALSQTPLR
jgi:hypothetical protein